MKTWKIRTFSSTYSKPPCTSENIGLSTRPWSTLPKSKTNFREIEWKYKMPIPRIVQSSSECSPNLNKFIMDIWSMSKQSIKAARVALLTRTKLTQRPVKSPCWSRIAVVQIIKDWQDYLNESSWASSFHMSILHRIFKKHTILYEA